MNVKQKTAALATLANITLTVIKFIAYTYTGSLAILSEAWHSLSDIATSFLVWLAVRERPPAIPKSIPKVGEFPEKEMVDKEKAAPSSNGEVSWWDGLNSICTEETGSLVISLILFLVSLNLFYGIAFSQKEALNNPLAGGILFLLFGISSYAVFQFETQIGVEENSVGLVSDGLHSKSDMIAAFLTGGSLIAYHFGLDIDRPVGFFIALLIFFLAVEVIVMSYRSRFRKKLKENPPSWDKSEQTGPPTWARPPEGGPPGVSHPGAGGPPPHSCVMDGGSPELLEFKTHRFLFSLFDLQTVIDVRDYLENRFQIQFNEIPVIGFFYKNGGRIVLFLTACGYFSTAIFLVGPSEKGIIERFGEFQPDRGLFEPGLHFKLPWPIETAHLVDTESVRSMDIGDAVAGEVKALLWVQEHGSGKPFLVGDNNFLYPYLTILFRVKDPIRFLNLHFQPIEIMRRVCLRQMTEMFSGVALYSMFSRGRRDLVDSLTKRLQESLDRLDSGILIETICLKDVHPPISVAPDFESVVSAEQAKQTMILNGYSYRNSEIPNARAKSESLVRSAEAYRLSREHEAHGETERFRLTEATFLETRPISRLRLYLEGIQEALQSARVILVDKKVDCPGLFVNTSNFPGANLFFYGKGGVESEGAGATPLLGEPSASVSGVRSDLVPEGGPLPPFETNRQLLEEVMDEGEPSPTPEGKTEIQEGSLKTSPSWRKRDASPSVGNETSMRK